MFYSALRKLYFQFPALQYRNYRLYFLGQLISFSGSWLQGVAQSWLIYSLTHSAFWLGVVVAVSAVPVLILSLFGGFLVDRISSRKLLFLTQSSSLILAFILGFLTINKLATLTNILILTFLSGIINALDNPASQAFVSNIVKKEDLPSAIGLNSTIFNTGRVLGPALAGFLITLVGIGNIFFINAISFLAILVSIYFIKVTPRINTNTKNSITAIKEGLYYSFQHPVISPLLITAGIGAVFCFSQATLLPVVASEVFSNGPQGLGLLLSSMGIGALLGSLLVSSQYKKVKASNFIILGCIAFVISTFAFSFTSDIFTASFFLLVAGLGLTVQFSTIYATVQRFVKEEYRGRVSSIYVLLFVGFSPIGNIFIGSAARLIGPLMAIRIATVAVSVFGAGLYSRMGKVRISYQNYDKLISDSVPS